MGQPWINQDLWSIDMRRLSTPPSHPYPLCADCVPFELVVSAVILYMKEELWGEGSNNVSNFHHHNINGGAVDDTLRHRQKPCKGNLPHEILCVYCIWFDPGFSSSINVHENLFIMQNVISEDVHFYLMSPRLIDPACFLYLISLQIRMSRFSIPLTLYTSPPLLHAEHVFLLSRVYLLL
jgi:hypothetical protein